jgi:hypothetical protein
VPRRALSALWAQGSQRLELTAAGRPAEVRYLVSVDPSTAGESAVRAGPRRPRRWPQWVLAAITVGCLVAAAVVFAVGWRWSEPPRLGVLGVPPPPRAQKAFAVVTRWYEAENEANVARMRELVCAHPSQSVTDWITTIAYYGQDQGLIFTDAVAKFRDEGATVWVKVAVRIRPLDDHMRHEVEDAQNHGGFFYEALTLADESGVLKVCDVELPQKATG